jgi:hypothetical protein
MRDYPIVVVHKVERLPIPEFIDGWSAEAPQLQRKLSSEEVQEPLRLFAPGINRTPEIAAAYESAEVQKYLRFLESYQGREASPADLATHLRLTGFSDGLTQYQEAADSFSPCRKVSPRGQSVFHGEGPNLGSAGGHPPGIRPCGCHPLRRPTDDS